MAFKQICESVPNEADGRAVVFDSIALGRDGSGDLYLTEPTHRNVVTWVAEEYQRVQLISEMWEFHHKRGTFLNAIADKETYKKTGIRRIDEHALYFVESGETARYPLIVRSYDWWQYEQQSNASPSASTPDTIVEMPGDNWVLYPTPSVAGTVKGDWWVTPFELLNADDETCWESHFDPLLKWGVLSLYAAEFLTEKSAEKLMARARLMYPALWSAFERKYLPDIRGARTFL